jgi:hypothetical protein
LNVKLYGAQGGEGNDIINHCTGNNSKGIPGKGGYIYANIPVIPKQSLYLFIGKMGGNSSKNGFGTGGFNGGGDGYNAGGGGGATDIRTDIKNLQSRIIVAGGGGGASQQSNGGIGGAKTTILGKGGRRYGGFAGDANNGGLRGETIYLYTSHYTCPINKCMVNSNGGFAYGGSGGFQAQAGGGGGYYGGGAGGTWGGGGGGSNYLKSGTIIEEISGYQTGDGMIIISYDL